VCTLSIEVLTEETYGKGKGVVKRGKEGTNYALDLYVLEGRRKEGLAKGRGEETVCE